jgi:glyoxylase-like metal-dependent hydrolase (beta-lactamase superfamily II)
MSKATKLVLLTPAAVALIVFVACASLPRTLAPRQPPGPKLYVFDCGHISTNDAGLFSDGGEYKGRRLEFPVRCYLVRHPKGDLQWDTGLSDTYVKNGRIGLMIEGLHLVHTNAYLQQLKALGVEPDTVEYLAMSHGHFDHTGNANYFGAATFLVQGDEYDVMFAAKPPVFFDPATYSELRKSKVVRLSGDYDVFGDGSVVIKRAAGHTPGSQVLFLKLARSGPIVLSGDLWHFEANRKFSRVPAFNFDKEQTRRSMATIEAFMRQVGAQLWIQHDAAQNTTVALAPKFYE